MKLNRARIGILFYFSSQWMGGIIYIINLVKILNHLEEEKKPEIFVFYRPELKRFLNEFNYPYLNLIEWSYPSVIKGTLLSLLTRKNLFVDNMLNSYELDAVFPLHDFPVKTRTNVKLISWWADLQHRYYPEFFTPMQNRGRELRIKNILKNCGHLVLSSQDVFDDFRQFYKIRDDMRVYIYHFVSVIENTEGVNINDLRLKYNLPEKYFLVSNQFHKHKNHKVVLQAVAKLKEEGFNLNLAFTGKLPSAQDSPYLGEIHHLIEDNDLHRQVNILGVIPRNDQLAIMRHSQAVIQPSLFEGWSTVIEDAVSLQVPVIASGLKVNKEQLGKDGCYFEPHDFEALAAILKCHPERDLSKLYYPDYNKRIREAANLLYDIFIS
ncbi:MAG: putative glycosyltransferase EpsF [Bacteroidetes bacterium ADurb.Bin145]|nr:MAG: putative glycosyltransferase EpsF [Bacteroidetes bacterium ADurb.Bin145]